MGTGKPELRAHITHRRQSFTTRERARSADLLRDRAIACPQLTAAGTVAAYVSVGTEPGTGPLLTALAARGTRVLLPVLLPDGDLDWAEHGPDGVLAHGPRGLREPTGRRLGTGAIAAVDAVVVPGLAVDRRGARLGRGGGSYDRALARVRSGTPVLLLLYDGEVLEHVPEEPHDRRVDVALTPSGAVKFTAARDHPRDRPRGSEHLP